jgi:hypothetical protein
MGFLTPVARSTKTGNGFLTQDTSETAGKRLEQLNHNVTLQPNGTQPDQGFAG